MNFEIWILKFDIWIVKIQNPIAYKQQVDVAAKFVTPGVAGKHAVVGAQSVGTPTGRHCGGGWRLGYWMKTRMLGGD